MSQANGLAVALKGWAAGRQLNCVIDAVQHAAACAAGVGNEHVTSLGRQLCKQGLYDMHLNAVHPTGGRASCNFCASAHPVRSAWLHFAACGLVGVATAYAYVWIAQVGRRRCIPLVVNCAFLASCVSKLSCSGNCPPLRCSPGSSQHALTCPLQLTARPFRSTTPITSKLSCAAFAARLVAFNTPFFSPSCPQHYTDYKYGPVKTIAEASTTGHATTIIAGAEQPEGLPPDSPRNNADCTVAAGVFECPRGLHAVQLDLTF